MATPSPGVSSGTVTTGAGVAISEAELVSEAGVVKEPTPFDCEFCTSIFHSLRRSFMRLARFLSFVWRLALLIYRPRRVT